MSPLLPFVDLKRSCVFGPRFRWFRPATHGYAANSERARQAERKEAEDCKRTQRRHSNLTPGTFAVFCPHGICHGFFLMPEGEGEIMVFDMFFNRLEGGAPGMIVYDRACTLHTSCLKREPWFFRNTRFRLDMLHSWNHSCCSEGYDPKVARERAWLGPDAYFNTQVAEQANAALAKISTSVAFMTAEHACLYTRSFLSRRNRRILASMRR